MSVDTLGVRFAAEGSENILNLIKQITSATGDLEGEIKKLTQTSKEAASGIGPAFSNLGKAMSDGTQKTQTLGEKVQGLMSIISKQGTTFGTAAASVWGIYNAYDSLEKVQLRASQSTVRVETLTTSLRSQEEQLRLARESGNLTAEQVAVKQERIADTAAKLGVAQERETILQEDVNEAWAGFASLIGPQVLAAAGSITQAVTSLTSSSEGSISMLARMKGGFSSLLNILYPVKAESLLLRPALGNLGPSATVAATGVRGLSGALKGLLIGTGIGVVLVAIGLLTEGFGLLGSSSAETADKVGGDLDKLGQAANKYGTGFAAEFSMVEAAMTAHAENIRKQQEAITATIKQSALDRMEIEHNKTRFELAFANQMVEDQKKLIQDLEKETNTFDFIGSLVKTKELEQARANLGALQADANTLDATFRNEEDAIKGVTAAFNDQNKTIIDSGEAWAKNTLNVNENFDSVEKMITAVKRNVDFFISSFTPSQLEAANAMESLTLLFEESGVSYQNNTELNAIATKYFDDRLKELFPDQEKQAKLLEKQADESNKLLQKYNEIVEKFHVNVPEAFLTSESALDAFGKTLEDNQTKIDKFRESTAFLKDFSTLEKALKLKVDVEDDVKDFVKHLDKDTRRKFIIDVEFGSNWNEVNKILTGIAPGIFTTDETGRVLDIVVKPTADKGDLEEYANGIIDILKDHFKKPKGGERNPIVQNVIDDLKAADTEEELRAALETAFKIFGVSGDEDILGDPTTAAEAAADKVAPIFVTRFGAKVNELGPLGDAILNLEGGEGVTYYNPKTGKLENKPREPKGSPTDYTAETKAAEEAAKKITDTFLNMSGKLSNIWLGMAKNWSGIMNSVITNAKAADTGVIKEFLNMSGKASNVFLGLASNWSKMMNSMIANAKSAANGINSALDGIKDQEVTIHVGLSGPGVPYLKHDKGGIHLAEGGIIDSAAKGQVYMTNGPQLVLIGDNPGGNEIHAMIPKNDPMPTVKSLIGVLGNMGHNTTSNITNSSNINNFGIGSGPIIINVNQPIYLDGKLIGENISRQTIDNLDRFYRS